MFHCGDQVLYGIHGVCKIICIECKKMGGKSTEYYVLEPVDQSSSRYYIPTQNEAAVAKLRPILTPEELNNMLNAAKTHTYAWLEDEAKRRQLYSDLLSGKDRAALVGMVYTLHNRKQQLHTLGRKLHFCDENFLRDAQKLLEAEFSLVLNIQQRDVEAYIKNFLDP